MDRFDNMRGFAVKVVISFLERYCTSTEPLKQFETVREN
jgi:hypothetical protein